MRQSGSESNDDSAVRRIFNTAIKVQEAKNKAALEAHLYEKKQQLKDQSVRDAARAKLMSPEQSFMNDRLLAENPLATVQIATEGEDPTSSVPSTRDIPTKTGTRTVAIPERQQQLLFMTKFNQMMDAANQGTGPRPHPVMQKVYEKYYQKVNGLKAPKTSGNQKDIGMTPSQINSRLNYLSKNADMEDPHVAAETKFLGHLLQTKSGFTSQNPSKYQVGQIVQDDSGNRFAVSDNSNPDDPEIMPYDEWQKSQKQ